MIAGEFSTSKTLQNLKTQVKYSVMIRLHLILFLDIMTFSLIDLKFYDVSTLCSSVNLGLSLLFLLSGGCWILIIPVMIKVKINKNLESHHDVMFESISTLVNEFKPCFQASKYQYYTIYLLYRMSFAFSLVVLQGSPSVQLFIIALFQAIISNIYAVFYIVFANPFKHRRDTLTVLLSEILCLVLVVFISIRSLDWISDSTKANSSGMCVLLIWITEVVIIVRYVLAISSSTRTALEPLGGETASAIVAPTFNSTTENCKDLNIKNLGDVEKEFVEESIENDSHIEIFQPKEFYNINWRNPKEIKYESESQNLMIPPVPSEIDIRIEKVSGIVKKLDINYNFHNTLKNTVINSKRGLIDTISLSPRKNSGITPGILQHDPSAVPNSSAFNDPDSASRRIDLNPTAASKLAANTVNNKTPSMTSIYANAAFSASVRKNQSVVDKNQKTERIFCKVNEADDGKREHEALASNYTLLRGLQERPNNPDFSTRVNESLSNTNSRFGFLHDRSNTIEEGRLATILENVDSSENRLENKGLGFNKY